MAIRIVRLGSERVPGEGLRIGTVRRPPRGVPKSEFAAQNWYDVWYPNLAPSVETMKTALAAETPAQCAASRSRLRCRTRALSRSAATARTSRIATAPSCGSC